MGGVLLRSVEGRVSWLTVDGEHIPHRKILKHRRDGGDESLGFRLITKQTKQATFVLFTTFDLQMSVAHICQLTTKYEAFFEPYEILEQE